MLIYLQEDRTPKSQSQHRYLTTNRSCILAVPCTIFRMLPGKESPLCQQLVLLIQPWGEALWIWYLPEPCRLPELPEPCKLCEFLELPRAINLMHFLNLVSCMSFSPPYRKECFHSEAIAAQCYSIWQGDRSESIIKEIKHHRCTELERTKCEPGEVMVNLS